MRQTLSGIRFLVPHLIQYFVNSLAEMSLKAVYMPPDVYSACTLHALLIEKEEIMGLLIGKFDAEENAHITSIILLQRSDKRKDRVEISAEQLNNAIIKTQALSEVMGEPINVLGWYHSHPHITVHPSHIDLRTQALYQQMDNRFVGIIFSVFNEVRNKTQEIKVTCFQSVAGDRGNPFEKKEIPLFIKSTRISSEPCMEAIRQLPIILREEDKTTYQEVTVNKTHPLDAFHNDANYISSQCHILRSVVNPLMLDAEHRIQSSKLACQQLEKEKERLLTLLQLQNNQ